MKAQVNKGRKSLSAPPLNKAILEPMKIKSDRVDTGYALTSPRQEEKQNGTIRKMVN